MESIEKITKISIPDDSMSEWMNVLREGGLSEDEIDAILLHLNKTYKELKAPFIVEREIEKIKEDLIKEYKYYLNDEQEQLIRRELEDKMGISKE